MNEYLRKLFETGDFSVRWQSGSWTGLHLWLHVLADVAIFATCVAIPVAIFKLLVNRALPSPRAFCVLAVFILAVGFVHAIEAVMFWWPAYRVSGLAKAITALLALITFYATARAASQAVSAPSLSELEDEIAQRRKAERRLQESEERYRALFDSTHDLIQSVSPEGQFMFVNRAWKSTLGYSEDDLGSLKVFDIVAPDCLDDCAQAFERVMSGEEVPFVQAEFLAKDGRRVAVEGNASPRKIDGKVVASHGFFRDVTARRQEERRRRDSEARFEAVFKGAGIGIAIVNEKGKYEQVNRAFLDMFGYTPDEIPDLSVDLLTVPKERVQSREALRHVVETGEMASIEKQCVTKDGDPFWVQVTVSRISGKDGAGFVAAMVENIDEDKKAEAQLAELNDRLEQLVQDRTAELRAARREAVIGNERLATLGQLAASIAHEIRSPLSVVRNAVYYLDKVTKEDADPGIRESFEDIDRGLSNAEHIIEELLDYTRRDNAREDRYNLSEVIDRVIHDASPPEYVKLTREDNSDEAVFSTGDAHQIERLVENLVRNAIQAIDDEGSVSIRCSRNGSAASVEVIDTGVGMTEEQLTRIFDPLYTNKSSGTGLGLTISKRYAELNQGELTVESTYGEGSRFRLTLPAVPIPSE